MLWPLLTVAALRVPNRKSILRALDLFASTNLDFADALSVAHMERMKLTTIISYDRDFDKVSGIQRKEP